MAMMKKEGYGQVEPNHLSAQRTGQIYAQDPVEASIKELENGMFLRLNTKTGELGEDGNGEWMLVYNEVKLYDNARQGYKDFRITSDETVGRVMYPRMFKVNVGDRYTTNMAEDAEVGAKLIPSKTGLVNGTDATDGVIFEVLKKTTMPDGQAAVKVVRVK